MLKMGYLNNIKKDKNEFNSEINYASDISAI